MIDPRNLLKAMFETFDMSARWDFKKFLEQNAGVTKWIISSDYCLHNNLDLAENVMAKADNMAVLRVIYTDEFQTARMVFEKSRTKLHLSRALARTAVRPPGCRASRLRS